MHFSNCLRVQFERPLFFSNSDVEKVRSTYQKLIALHREFNHQDDVICCYDTALQTFHGDESAFATAEASSSCSEMWLNFAMYLLGREKLPEDCWEKVRELEKQLSSFDWLIYGVT